MENENRKLKEQFKSYELLLEKQAIELTEFREKIENQQKIITQLDIQLQKKTMTIDYLTEQLTHKSKHPTVCVDLLDIRDIN